MTLTTTRRDFLTILGAGAATAAFSSPAAGDPAKTTLLDPYATIDWRTIEKHKAALHVHTLQSDGHEPVDKVVRAYRRAGYTILSITDHDWNEPNRQIAWGEIPAGQASPYPLAPGPTTIRPIPPGPGPTTARPRPGRWGWWESRGMS